MMIPKTTWVGDMSDKKEFCNRLTLVKLNRLKSHKYKNTKLNPPQKFL